MGQRVRTDTTPIGAGPFAAQPRETGRRFTRIFGRALLLLIGVAAAWMVTSLLDGSSAGAQTVAAPPPAAPMSAPGLLADVVAPVVLPVLVTVSDTTIADPVATPLVVPVPAAIGAVVAPVLDVLGLGSKAPGVSAATAQALGGAVMSGAGSLLASSAPTLTAAASSPQQPAPPADPREPGRRMDPVGPSGNAGSAPTTDRGLAVETDSRADDDLQPSQRHLVLTDIQLQHAAADPSFSPD